MFGKYGKHFLFYKVFSQYSMKSSVYISILIKLNYTGWKYIPVVNYFPDGNCQKLK